MCDEVGFLTILDSAGTLLWYLPLLDDRGGLFNLTADGSVVAMGNDLVQEWGMEGDLRRVFTRGEHFEHRLQDAASAAARVFAQIDGGAKPEGAGNQHGDHGDDDRRDEQRRHVTKTAAWIPACLAPGH